MVVRRSASFTANAARCFVAIGLEVGRRDLHAEVAVVVLARPEVADQREQRTDLPSEVLEVDRVDRGCAMLLCELLHGLDVVLPVPTTDHERGDSLAFQEARGRVGLHEGAHRHARGQPPRRRSDDHEVIVTALRRVRDADLTRRTAKLRGEQRDDVEIPVLERKHREAPGIARIRELDLGPFDVETAIAKHGLHILGDLECLLREGVVHEQHAVACCRWSSHSVRRQSAARVGRSRRRRVSSSRPDQWNSSGSYEVVPRSS